MLVEVCILAGKLAAQASRTVERVIESIGSPLSSINGPEGSKLKWNLKASEIRREMKGACNAGEERWSHHLSWFWPVKLSGSDCVAHRWVL